MKSLVLTAWLLLGVPSESHPAEPIRIEVSYRAKRKWTASPEAILREVADPMRFPGLMPGLQRVQQVAPGVWLWETETAVPLAAPQRNRFRVQLMTQGDSLAIWRSVSDADPDWLECRAQLRRPSAQEVSLELEFRMRLVRPSLTSVHWLAPVVGERFLRERVRERLIAMVEGFLERLQSRL
ncbi:MAG: hypothetical protein N2561_00365 [Bacteroidetes bacterium]|nr:hypothetical protein [Rhodothermia bacterium]MCS7155710.1 hypothetical protein [Bacteroidota bacterium]MCX7905980.1 hypothetical protein [Bacteroidota bacterium]MDW8138778.1 hypothetical protein [Bacteroidota bacterium]MDW8285737.1 hypothetical protein [Bacteroidota bacterium]